MRIIAGEFGGRIIKMPSSKYTRPTTDKMKESLFNYLNNIIDFEGIKVCDIYAGSGALGLEALSRGASLVHFVEKNFPVFKVLSENIKSLKAENFTKIFKMNAVRYTSLPEQEKFELILADPPFFKDDIHKVVENILENKLLTGDGLLIVERSIQTKEKDMENFGKEPFKKMGDSLIYRFSYDE
ncbi:MAG: 16S rRNA (guanine(966)-N(2))-methyltransferase RsmD [Chlorobi bacterium]|nr:16S rRNA (guanine(966)-N(2))-methyltransferase RsmD [Chlorobiota bacterium]